MDESNSPLRRVVNLSAEILQLCSTHPELSSICTNGLEAISKSIHNSQRLASTNEILRHIDERKEKGSPIQAKTNHYRMIAAQLSKRHHIPFDRKRSRKRITVLEWLDDNWDTVRHDFFVLLDKIEETLAEVD
jgi:hypothetical protein